VCNDDDPDDDDDGKDAGNHTDCYHDYRIVCTAKEEIVFLPNK